MNFILVAYMQLYKQSSRLTFYSRVALSILITVFKNRKNLFLAKKGHMRSTKRDKFRAALHCNIKAEFLPSSCHSYQILSYLVKEGSTCQHHGQLTGVVGVVEPGLMRDVPRMVTARETHNAVPCFSPHPRKAQV